ncbi:Gfo/Idh/MocA family protein [Alicyclobacillus shizuokensis]|uniref:Gfo/Idh/MocA family protein n=1 Tax=Alicyclobacillus shizuokensis TaxID=392014 RepID=UPI000836BBE6|nr:Gfo/Idh/MocA family oxidoreductase [Alicyclobacillus shizuokensis]MCL6627554.1 Gfo/Idh/MocA family oxidoreductase [Alicyclobacillus shizuokensis]
MGCSPRYRVGIAGAGAFAAFLAQALAPLPNFELTAVAGRTPRKRQTVIEAYLHRRSGADAKRPQEYEDATQLVAAPGLDAVILTTPPHLHASLTALALKEGKHVLAEKPGALSVETLAENGRLADGRGLALAVNLVQPFNPLVEAVRRLLELGVFGRPWQAILYNSAHRVPDDSHWFWSHEMSGGIFVEHGVHFFEVARRWFGEAATAAGDVVPDEQGRESRVFAQVVHADRGSQQEVVVQYYHGFTLDRDIPESTGWTLHLAQGRLQINGWIPTDLRVQAKFTRAQAELCDRVLDAVPTQPTHRALERLTSVDAAPVSSADADERIAYERTIELADRQGWYEAMAQARWLDFCRMMEEPGWRGLVSWEDAAADLALAIACAPGQPRP